MVSGNQNALSLESSVFVSMQISFILIVQCRIANCFRSGADVFSGNILLLLCILLVDDMLEHRNCGGSELQGKKARMLRTLDGETRY